MNYLLYNPLASNGKGTAIKDEAILSLRDRFQEFTEINVLELDKEEFILQLKEEDIVVLVGGDGTLNHFANAVYELNVKNKIYLYRAGTGNDFSRDISLEGDLIDLKPYLSKLPKIRVNGKVSYFINGIGYGIDGMVCEVADDLRSQGIKDINYTKIAIQLLMMKYKRPNAKVLVDGKEYRFKKVWFASSMNGQYYGAGMMVAPGQNRLTDDLTFVTVQKLGRLRALMIFPSIFKGEHIKKTNNCIMIKGKHIEVYFSKPMALQIDGEVVRNVTHYEVFK